MIESNPLEVHQQRPQFIAFKQLDGSSLSEIKSATLNSSYYQNGLNSPIFNKKVGIENQSPLINSNSETNRMRKFPVPDVNIKYFSETGRVQQKVIQSLIIKFIKNLKEQTKYYKEGVFNQFQKTFLIEKYLENVIQKKKNQFSLLQYLFWEFTIYIILLMLLLWVPLNLAFPETEKNTINGIIIMLLCVDFFKSYLKSLIKNQKKQNMFDILLIIFFILTQYSEVIWLQQIALLGSLMVTYKKIQEKYEIWSIYIGYDLHYFFVFCRLLLLIHYCTCIFLSIRGEYFDESENFTSYCYSIYWSTASLLNISQSVVVVESQIELIYQMVIMLMSCYVFSYVLHHTINFIKDSETKDQIIRKQLKEVNKYFSGRTVSLQLKSQIRSFIKNTQHEHIENSIVSKLPLQLRDQLFFETRLSILEKCEVLQQFSKNVHKRLTQYMQEVCYPEDHVIDEESLYIVQSGRVQIREVNKKIGILTKGETFGQYQFFTGIKQNTIYKTKEQTVLYKISQQDFLKTIQYEFADYERFMFIKQCLLNGNYKIINLNCKFCESYKHLISNCPLINYKPNIEKLIKLSTFGTQIRQKNHRNNTYRNRMNNQVFARLQVSKQYFRLIVISQDYLENKIIQMRMKIPLMMMNFHLKNPRTQNLKVYIQVIPIIESLNQVRRGNNFSDVSTFASILKLHENLANTQEIQEEVRHSESNEQPTLQYKVSFWPVDQPNKKSCPQLEQVSLKELDDPKGERIKKKQSQLSMKNIYSKNREHETLNLSEEQLTFTKQGGKQLKVKQVSILTKNSENLFQDKQLQVQRMFSNSPQFVDLEIKGQNQIELDIDSFREYKIYYPQQNAQTIVRSANKQIVSSSSNFSFKERVRQISQQLQMNL